jgi:hypothetical protein
MTCSLVLFGWQKISGVTAHQARKQRIAFSLSRLPLGFKF